MKKKFIVTRLADSSATFLDEEITADYVLYQMGMLIFKNEKAGSYPEVIQIYAATNWVRVKLASSG
jgi:hypothetical protein